MTPMNDSDSTVLPLGRVVATERKPNTPHEFHFWTALDSPVGIGGSRLSVAQRQKLGLARAIIKRPDMLVLFDALGPLDLKEQIERCQTLLESSRTGTWAD